MDKIIQKLRVIKTYIYIPSDKSLKVKLSQIVKCYYF